MLIREYANMPARNASYSDAGGRIILLSIAVLAVAVFIFSNYRDTSASECGTLVGDKRDECEALEEKQKAYEKIIDLKQQQQLTLQQQIDYLNGEQGKMQKDISSMEEEIKTLDGQIEVLAQAIVDKEAVINSRKEVLSGLLRSYYEYSSANTLEIALKNKTLSDFFSNADYISQLQSEVNEILESIQMARRELVEEKRDLDFKNNRNRQAKQELVDRNQYLEVSEKQKNDFLMQTQNQEQKYQDLLARVEEQKQELMSLDELATEAGVSPDEFDKPKDDLASTSWYYSQRDSRWGETYIGNSNTKMKSYGCAVSSVAMVFTYHGSSITPKTLAKQPIYYWDLIAWPKSWPAAKVELASCGTSHGNINWKTVDKALESEKPVIVYIKKNSGGGGHYVVIHHKDKKGRYIVHDPYWGPNLFLDTSRSLVGALKPKGGTSMDQMIIYEK